MGGGQVHLALAQALEKFVAVLLYFGRKLFVAAELFTVGCGELPEALLAAG